MPMLCAFFKPRSYVSIPKVDLGGGESTGSLCRSSRCGDIEYTAFYALIITCFFNQSIDEVWLIILVRVFRVQFTDLNNSFSRFRVFCAGLLDPVVLGMWQ